MLDKVSSFETKKQQVEVLEPEENGKLYQNISYKKILANNKLLDKSFLVLTFLSVFFIVLIFAVILATIIVNGYERITWEFIFEAPKEGMTEGGIFPAIVGTILLVIIMAIFSIPLGTVSAIVLNEYLKEDSYFYKIITFSVSSLASVPAIVIGLFGLGFFVIFVGGNIDRLFFGGELVWGKPALIWASLTMGTLTLPVVIVSVQEALRAVPKELREGAYALGATKYEVVTKVVLPKAVTGVITGSILAVSRGAGEVAPILFTGAVYFLPYIPSKLTDQFMELGYHIYVMSTQSPDVDATLPIQFATTAILLLLTFILNFISILLRRRLRVLQSKF